MILKTTLNTTAQTSSLRERFDAYAQSRSDPVRQAEVRLERIARDNSSSHLFVHTNHDLVLQQARASARRWRLGRERGLLDGAFFAVKDNMVCAHMPTHAGGPAALELPGVISPLISRMLRAGMILLGKLNMDEGAYGVSTQNPWWGACLNPLDAERSPGGSSGGSAAAVAAGLCDASLGTDTMGSIRIPAAYCGLWGLKPSWRASSLRGVVPLCHALDTVGPLASTLDELIAVFQVIDRTTVPVVAPCTLRVGLVQGSPEFALDAAHQEALAQLTHLLSACGHRVVKISLPPWDPVQDRKLALLLASSGGAKTWSVLPQSPLHGLSEPTRRAFEYGAAVDPARQKLATQRLRILGRAAAHWFESVDVLLMPVTPTLAPLRTEPIDPQIAQVCCLANLTACPALAFPLAIQGSSMAASFQMMGPKGSDAHLLGVTAMLRAQQVLH